jgi:hypothetical protein
MPAAWRRRSAVRRRGCACGGPPAPRPEVSCARLGAGLRLEGWRAGNRRTAVCSAAVRAVSGSTLRGGVGSQGDGGVAELVLHDLEVGSRGQGDGGGAVPQPVQRDRRQPGGGDQLREQAGHPVRPERGPGHGGEHVPGLGPPGGGPLGPLPGPVLAQRGDGGLVQGDDPAPGAALRRPGGPATSRPPSCCSCPDTVSVPASRSRSLHRRPAASPRRGPRSATRWNSAYSRWPRTWARNCAVWAAVHTPTAGLQPSSCQRPVSAGVQTCGRGRAALGSSG